MRPINIKTCCLLIGMLLIMQACNAVPATEVLHITEPITEVPATPVVHPPTEVPATPTLPEETIQHVNIPVSLPAAGSARAGDFDSSKVSRKNPAIGGDYFTRGPLERPFNANTMDVYFPSLDIVGMNVFQDDTWIYGVIQLTGRETDPALVRSYALELDLDHDSKGDWLVMASNPLSTDWTVKGVQVYQDANGDVGSITAMYADPNVTIGDGFETKVFDQGAGDDPDTAWARTSPTDPNTIEITVKRSVLGNPKNYLIGMWAGSSLLDPALFDLNDHFSAEQAGAADPSFTFYPIKEVAEIDNTCRMAVGFQTGKEPGLCKGFAPTLSDQNPGGFDNGGSSSGGGCEGGGEPGPGVCPPCPPGMDQNPYPDCSCYSSLY